MIKKKTPEMKDVLKSKFVPHVRNPEWDTRARVAFESLGADRCRYTPSEEPPYLFCGEPAVPGKAWCKNCMENIVYHKEEGGK